MDLIANRKYPPPIEGADWTVSAVDLVAVTLSIALSQRVSGWPGATDEELGAVAREIIAALDGRPMEQTVDALSAGGGTEVVPARVMPANADEAEFYDLHDDLPRELPGVVSAIDAGGGQTCDVAGVLRKLRERGYVIAMTTHTESE